MHAARSGPEVHPVVSRIEALLARRGRERAAAARPLAVAGLMALECHGVEAGVVGSLARGTMLQHSDIDFLILDPGTHSITDIIGILEPVLGNFPFDVIPLQGVQPEMRNILLSELRRASDLHPDPVEA
jgi:predicted nucleotidyltransferase